MVSNYRKNTGIKVLFKEMAGESSLEDFPEIIDPEDEANKSNRIFSEDEEEEAEPTLEEKLAELVQNLLHKTAATVIKAMKDLEQMVAQGENVAELVNAADQLIIEIRDNCNGQLDYEGPTGCQLLNLLLIRFEEERVNMKKAAITAVQALFLQLRDPRLVNVCADRLALKCRDLALAVRKQAAISLTRLLQGAPELGQGRLHSTWTHAVMHQIVDREPSVQQQAAKLVSEMLLEPIVHGSGSNLVWTLLASIEEEADLRRLLLRALVHLFKEKLLPKQLVKSLLNRAAASPEFMNPCWMLLSELSAFFDVPHGTAVEHLSERLDLAQANRLVGYMAKLVANRADQLSVPQRNFLKDKLSEALLQHNVHPSYIGSVYYLYARLLKGVAGPQGGLTSGRNELQKFNQRWYSESLRSLDKMIYADGEMSVEQITGLEEQLEAHIRAARGDTSMQEEEEDYEEEEEEEEDQITQPNSVLMTPLASPSSVLQLGQRTPTHGQMNGNGNGNDTDLPGTIRENCDRLIRQITSIGECIQYTPALISKRLFRFLQVIIASDLLQKIHTEHVEQGTTVPTSPVMSRIMSPNTSFHTVLPGMPGSMAPSVAPSQVGAGSPTHTVYTAGGGILMNSHQIRIRKRAFRTELMTRQVRATAVLTLGKLCLQDEPLAKKCIPVFIRELKQNPDHFVRNNIVVVICDLCIRYTSMVDRYSTLLASCLRDQSILIRRQTLMLLTNLIKEQFLKWEGPIIYRFVTALLDTDPCVKDYAKFCLNDILLPQFKERMFFHHFLECVFTFNGVMHASWVPKDDGFELNREVDKQCSLEGRHKFDQRMQLYKYMLSTFEDQQKVAVLEKIGLEVFVPLVEGGLRLSDLKVRNLLFDAFRLMATQEIKLKMHLGKQDVDYEGPDDEEPPELVKTAAKKLISSTFRKTIADTVMPHLFSISAFLTEKRSPLAKCCYAVILEMCHDHEEQLDEFLASDPRLKAEIRFDLKRLRPNNNINNRQRSQPPPATPSRPGSQATTVDLH